MKYFIEQFGEVCLDIGRPTPPESLTELGQANESEKTVPAEDRGGAEVGEGPHGEGDVGQAEEQPHQEPQQV